MRLLQELIDMAKDFRFLDACTNYLNSFKQFSFKCETDTVTSRSLQLDM